MNFFLTIKLFLSFSVFPFFQLVQLLECLSGYMYGDNLIMKFPPDFHEFLSLIYHCSTKWICFRLQTSKRKCKKEKKNNIMKWLLGGVLQNSFPKSFSKFAEKYLCESLSNTVKSFHAVRLATFLKKDPLIGVLEQTVFRSSRK